MYDMWDGTVQPHPIFSCIAIGKFCRTTFHNDRQEIHGKPQHSKRFWDLAPCGLVKLTDVSEVLTASIITTRGNIPEDSHVHTRRRENLKSHLLV
jgi:hypothetical protein